MSRGHSREFQDPAGVSVYKAARSRDQTSRVSLVRGSEESCSPRCQQSDGEAYGEGRDERKDGVSNAHSNPGRRAGRRKGNHLVLTPSPRDGETVVEVEGVVVEREMRMSQARVRKITNPGEEVKSTERGLGLGSRK